MDSSRVEGDRQWVEHWRKAGPELERIRRKELRRFRHEENVTAIDALLELGTRMGPPRTTSGMVEMQRLFHGTGQ